MIHQRYEDESTLNILVSDCSNGSQYPLLVLDVINEIWPRSVYLIWVIYSLIHEKESFNFVFHL